MIRCSSSSPFSLLHVCGNKFRRINQTPTTTTTRTVKTTLWSRRWMASSSSSSASASSSSSSSSSKSSTNIINTPSGSIVFDKKLKEIQRCNAALLSNSYQYDYFRLETANRLLSRLLDVEREFPKALEIGSNSGEFYKALINHIKNSDHKTPKERRPGGIQTLLQLDTCETMLKRDEIPFDSQSIISCRRELYQEERGGEEGEGEGEGEGGVVGGRKEQFDSQGKDLSLNRFSDHEFDIVISNMHLQWVNDLPKLLQNIQRILKPDGCFIGSMAASGTLQELRSSLILAEQERLGGIGNHLSPMVRISDVGDLLSRCGFALVTVDSEVISIPYPNMFVLMEHLHGTGDNHCAFNREKFVSKDIFMAAASIYDAMYPIQQDPSQSPDDIDIHKQLRMGETNTIIDASFHVAYFIAWSPHESQPKPLERGSQSHNLKDLENILQDVHVASGESQHGIFTKPQPPSSPSSSSSSSPSTSKPPPSSTPKK